MFVRIALLLIATVFAVAIAAHRSSGAGPEHRYLVKLGDSLWSIARRFDVHVNDLGNWNDVLSRGDKRMKIGTPLTIWPGAKADLPEPSAKR